jgi:hypothetical protein
MFALIDATTPDPNPTSPTPEPEETAENKPQDERFHPGKHHEHMVIHPPSTGVPHVDPGAVVFS